MFNIICCIIVFFLSIACQNKNVLDESVDYSGDKEELLASAHDSVTAHDNKEALKKLQAISRDPSLTIDESRYVRDNIVEIYMRDRKFREVITYLKDRDSSRNLTENERKENLFTMAEAYHGMSYNYWARFLGIGSPYRCYKDAKEAQRLYILFITKYPQDPKCSYVKGEINSLSNYLESYKKELNDYQKNRVSS